MVEWLEVQLSVADDKWLVCELLLKYAEYSDTVAKILQGHLTHAW